MRKGNGKGKSPSLFSWLRRTAFEYLYPARCICCHNAPPVGIKTGEYVMLADPDSELRFVFCEKCMSDFLTSCAAKCPTCGRPYVMCRCVPDALRDAGIVKMHVFFGYDKSRRGAAAPKLIYSLKSMDNRDSINFAAHLLCGLVRDVMKNDIADIADIADIVVTYAPRRNASVREHGGDHMRETAKLMAKELGCGFVTAFYSCASGEQKKRTGVGRMEAAECIKAGLGVDKLYCRSVIIVDDIITSGATLGRCASLAFAAGARDVKVFALGRSVYAKME